MAIALITGTSTGIGLATAVALGRAGHNVYAAMRNPKRTSELRTIAKQEVLPIVILPLDVDDDDSVRGAVDRVLAERGRIDVLVNNAGIARLGSIEELPLTEFRKTLETNLFGALRCIQAVLPHMRKQRRGCIINNTSLSGRIAISPQGPYAASKFALEAVSEVLAQEVRAFNIRIAIIEPGIVKTPIFDKLGERPNNTHYPQERRIRALYTASLAHAVSASVVGEQIRQIVEDDSWQLRYPVGPDAGPFLAWRNAMADEEWVDFGAMQEDEAWCARIEQDFGLDIRPYL
jgi:NAD(P)-dependent dehydrogenase (short-subunit alcohol dehydrogenase family)